MITQQYANNLKILPTFSDKEFDILIDDPPYELKQTAHRKNNRSKLAKTRKYDTEVWYQKIPSQKYFNHAFRVSKQQIIFGINYFIPKRKLPIHSGRIVWDKVNGKNNFSDCEEAYCSFHNSTRLFRFMWNGMMQGKSLAEPTVQQPDKRKNQKRTHPCEKPILLYVWILLNYAKPGDKILDCHAGSGSLAIAVQYLNDTQSMNLTLVTIEVHKAYYQDSKNNLNKYNSQIKLFT